MNKEGVTILSLRRQAIWLLVLTAVLWSSSGLFIKVISWQPLAILSGRSMLASLVVLIYLGRLNFRWTRLQIVGALGYVGSQLFFITATKLTTAANAIFLQYTVLFYLGLFGYWFLAERPRRADWVAMGVIFLLDCYQTRPGAGIDAHFDNGTYPQSAVGVSGHRRSSRTTGLSWRPVSPGGGHGSGHYQCAYSRGGAGAISG